MAPESNAPFSVRRRHVSNISFGDDGSVEVIDDDEVDDDDDDDETILPKRWLEADRARHSQPAGAT